MKAFALMTLAGTAAAQWWGGAPTCAQSCLSSFYPTNTGSTGWPTPTAFCSDSPFSSASSCLVSACSATPTAVSSYSSLASSLCAQYSSCEAAGSTGVYTLPWPPGSLTTSAADSGSGTSATTESDNAGPTTVAPQARAPQGPGGGVGAWGGDAGNWGSWGAWGSTFDGSSVMVTGCAWDGSPWVGGAGGSGWGGWGDWGAGWTWSTQTTTVTETATASDGSLTLSTNVAAVALAVSGSVTSTTTLAASQTSSTSATASSSVSAGAKKPMVAVGAIVAGIVGFVYMM